MENKARKEIGTRIRLIRKNLRLNQDQFGSKIGVTKSTVSAYEHGDVFPPLEVMAKIVESGKVSYDWLFTGLEATEEGKTPITYPLGEKEEKAIQEVDSSILFTSTTKSRT